MEKNDKMNALITTSSWSKDMVKISNDGLNIQTKNLNDAQNNMVRLIFAKMTALDCHWQVEKICLTKEEIFKTLKLNKNDIQRDWWNFNKTMKKFYKEVLSQLTIYNETTERSELISLVSKMTFINNPTTLSKKEDVAVIEINKSAREFFYELGKSKPFFTYQLGQYIQLKGYASKTLFENLRRYYWIKTATHSKYSEKFYSVEEIKIMLDMKNYRTIDLTQQLKKVIVPRLRKTLSFETLTMEVVKSYNQTIGYQFRWSTSDEEERIKQWQTHNQLINDGYFTEEELKAYRSGSNKGRKSTYDDVMNYMDAVEDYHKEQLEEIKQFGYHKGAINATKKKKRQLEEIEQMESGHNPKYAKVK